MRGEFCEGHPRAQLVVGRCDSIGNALVECSLAGSLASRPRWGGYRGVRRRATCRPRGSGKWCEARPRRPDRLGLHTTFTPLAQVIQPGEGNPLRCGDRLQGRLHEGGGSRSLRVTIVSPIHRRAPGPSGRSTRVGITIMTLTRTGSGVSESHPRQARRHGSRIGSLVVAISPPVGGRLWLKDFPASPRPAWTDVQPDHGLRNG